MSDEVKKMGEIFKQLEKRKQAIVVNSKVENLKAKIKGQPPPGKGNSFEINKTITPAIQPGSKLIPKQPNTIRGGQNGNESGLLEKRKPNPNWSQFLENQSKQEGGFPQGHKRKQTEEFYSNHKTNGFSNKRSMDYLNVMNPLPSVHQGITPIIALDCEMVMISNNRHALARCSIVNYNGAIVLDSYYRPMERVVNFITWVSGITPYHLRNAPNFDDEAKKHIHSLLAGRIIVGHSLTNDFAALDYEPDDGLKLRDLKSFKPLHTGKHVSGLKKLAEEHLGLTIQSGNNGHSSVEDARAALCLYRKFEREWERNIKRASHTRNYSSVKAKVMDDVASLQ